MRKDKFLVYGDNGRGSRIDGPDILVGGHRTLAAAVKSAEQIKPHRPSDLLFIETMLYTSIWERIAPVGTSKSEKWIKHNDLKKKQPRKTKVVDGWLYARAD